MTPCDSGQVTPALVPFFRRSTLRSALNSIWVWELDRQKFGFGTVALGYQNGYWVVLVSQDLIEAALPF